MRPRFFCVPLAFTLAAGLVGAAPAQQAPIVVHRQAAVDSALARGPRLAIARADTALAAGKLLTAGAWQNPSLATSYSKAVPQYHVTVDLPLEYPWLRRSRIGSARATREAAQYRFEFERAAVALEADTTYTRATAALAHGRLSRRNAEDADSLRRMALVRREVGDASDLDVELATVNAGQQENLAAADSLALESALLTLRAVMGLPADAPPIAIDDSLVPPAPDRAPPAGTPLQVAAAEQAVSSADLAARLERRSIFGTPSLTAGFETGDPQGTEPGILPTIGLSLPLPLLSQRRGPIAQAEAERARSRAELALAQLESRARIATAKRQRDVALVKLTRDLTLFESAGRVAAMSLVAYHEGASSLPNVLEAQRTAREIQAQYIDDLATAWIAGATLRLFTLTAPSSPSP